MLLRAHNELNSPGSEPVVFGEWFPEEVAVCSTRTHVTTLQRWIYSKLKTFIYKLILVSVWVGLTWAAMSCKDYWTHPVVGLTLFFLSFLIRRRQFRKKTTSCHQRQDSGDEESYLFSGNVVKMIQRKLPRMRNVELQWLNTHLEKKKKEKEIRSRLVQKDQPVIRMALSLPSVSLANADEHRTDAWIGLDMDWICLLFAGPEETLSQ